ncbi:putative 5-methyltetrahydropteroyltriglutamate-homocysteine methyltransferase [Smittium mucronatum]|uniref:5-methyltetrahydropteroyltriglutamate--homocysteine S-methyltransferase n=1 Tax=Smittium mucronatum TaxID=133383 RepID=A0A1R0GY85_9FUNG|nr:putative 5-methyltetrahydropteroyltriglutamate-homocysteine methyltransferase [Smittium mucronatum]
MVFSSVLGFPRMGSDRQLKKAVEAYWKGKSTRTELISAADELKIEHWNIMKSAGIDVIPVGDFSLYDHILDAALMFNVIPARFEVEFSAELAKIRRNVKSMDVSQELLDIYFAMARGVKKSKTHESADEPNHGHGHGHEETDGIPSLEMKKWFDTNYHSMVPEISKSTNFMLLQNNVKKDFILAKNNGIITNPHIIGPITFLHYCKLDSAVESASFNKWNSVNKLVELYAELVLELEASGSEWVTIEEPVLATDLNKESKEAFLQAYKTLYSKLLEGRPDIQNDKKIKVMLANYFGSYKENLDLALDLPFEGLHFDLVLGKSDFESAKLSKLNGRVVSLGLIDGRNIWRADTFKIYKFYNDKLSSLLKDSGASQIIINSSCPLLYVPFSTAIEKEHLEENVFNKLAFAVEKVFEINNLKNAINKQDSSSLSLTILENDHQSNSVQKADKLSSNQNSHNTYENDVSSTRLSDFQTRNAVQKKLFDFPNLPTTTIGSFPQTEEIRVTRQKFRKNLITKQEYEEFIKEKIRECIKWQIDLDLDVLVHGEYERTDMVEFFGHFLTGFTTTKNGWVQSYGSRCVKPPIIYGDVKRKSSMTVEITKFAQDYVNEILGLENSRPVKGMLTGPVTIIQWSFVRNDIPISQTAMQIALAIREEVLELESNGITVIQVDEPAIREGLPLRKEEQKEYRKWSVTSFKIATSGVKDSTQIHTHMCYSDFNEILGMIISMDADVLTIENSKSNLKLIEVDHLSSAQAYKAEIGPGLYDVHSPLIPTVNEMKLRAIELLKVYKKESLWINPDCGNKTRTVAEVDAALRNMVAVAKELRKTF